MEKQYKPFNPFLPDEQLSEDLRRADYNLTRSIYLCSAISLLFLFILHALKRLKWKEEQFYSFSCAIFSFVTTLLICYLSAAALVFAYPLVRRSTYFPGLVFPRDQPNLRETIQGTMGTGIALCFLSLIITPKRPFHKGAPLALGLLLYVLYLLSCYVEMKPIRFHNPNRVVIYLYSIGIGGMGLSLIISLLFFRRKKAKPSVDVYFGLEVGPTPVWTATPSHSRHHLSQYISYDRRTATYTRNPAVSLTRSGVSGEHLPTWLRTASATRTRNSMGGPYYSQNLSPHTTGGPTASFTRRQHPQWASMNRSNASAITSSWRETFNPYEGKDGWNTPASKEVKTKGRGVSNTRYVPRKNLNEPQSTNTIEEL